MSIFVWSEFTDPGVDAYDIVDGNITGLVERVGELNPNKPGLYTLEYGVEDSHGNEAEPVYRYIYVINRAPDSLTLSNSQIMENATIGETVGTFTATDPDDLSGEKSYSFSVVSESNSSLVPFVLESNGTLSVGADLDFEQQETYRLMVRVSDEYNGSYQEEFEIGLIDAHQPIVDTQEILEYESSGYQIGGFLLDDGGRLDRVHVGVLVSGQPILNREQAGVSDFPLQLDEQSLAFSRFYGPDPTWKKIYVRAYAYNEEGISYGLEERVSLNPVLKTRDAWSGATPVSGAKGWWESEWFGHYFKSEQSGWILHPSLGWVYPSPSLDNGLWMWKEGVGWIWTEQGVYPYFFSNLSGDWLYFFGQFNQQRLLYDYGRGRWLYLNEVGVDEREGTR